MFSAPGAAGVIVISAWHEGSGLRARIIWTLDVTSPAPSMATAGSLEEVLTAVRASLEAFLEERGSIM
jgi:hypothetical protein